jgi:hypothetical protein
MSSNPFVKTLSNVFDVTALLYLNPELTAYSNLRTAEDALDAFESYATLPNTMPSLPLGFNPKVFIAAQNNVSTLNRSIRDAMVASEGINDASLDRKGSYIGTILRRATLLSFIHLGNIEFELQDIIEFSSDVVQVGDHLRISCKQSPCRGSIFIDGVVESVEYDTRRFSISATNNPQAQACLNYAGTTFDVFGIKIYDPIRQARISYARASDPTPPSENFPDVVPMKRFVYDMYQLMYPETRGYTVSDTYIDYRSKWTRGTEYRLRDGSDIYNMVAPYTGSSGGGGGFTPTNSNTFIASVSNNAFIVSPSNTSIGGGFVCITSNTFVAGFVNGGNFYATDSNACMCSNLIVTPNSASVTSPFIFETSIAVGRSNGMVISVDSASLGFGNLLIQSSNEVRVRNILNIGETLGVGISNPEPDSGVRLSVGGDIFTTGTVVTLSDKRVKSNFEIIQEPLKKICALNGCTYNVKNIKGEIDFRRRHTGLVAQDVMNVLPEAVYDMSDGMKTVAYGNLVGVLVEAMKELVSRVEKIELIFNNSLQLLQN